MEKNKNITNCTDDNVSINELEKIKKIDEYHFQPFSLFWLLILEHIF